MGKGDGRRPAAVDEATAAANWARTFGKKVDAFGPTWTDTTPAPMDRAIERAYRALDLATVMCQCGHSAYEHMPDCCLCRGGNYNCDCDKDQSDVLLDALAVEAREARIARHLKDVFPLVFEQMAKEVAG